MELVKKNGRKGVKRPSVKEAQSSPPPLLAQKIPRKISKLFTYHHHQKGKASTTHLRSLQT
jgi:hypothetical protein